MKSAVFSASSTIAGLVAAIAAKSVIEKVWPGQPSKNPADRSSSWPEALRWALASSIGAGVARLAARRAAAAGWEQATGEAAPGLGNG